ncbi:MAG: RNA polymerase sigma factor [Candidatus Taylorbacteria bacterium]|nr:RNA polymerase sigma factor [Candidatus Taylorbacteria bacterium]
MDHHKEAQFLDAYKEHTDALFRYCYFKTLNRDEAKDMLQDTFIKTWQYIQGGGEVLNIKAFLYRTAHNIVVDHYRKKKSVSLDELFEEGFDTSHDTPTVQDLENQIDGAEAMKLLDKIPKQYRDLIFMKYVEELSIKEIAEILDEPANNISVKIHRAIEKLKEIYNDREQNV